jgi:hypothetical protein
MRYRVPLLVLFTAMSLLPLRAEDIRVTARVDSTIYLIGDWVTVHLDVTHLPTVRIERPAMADSIQGFELVKRDTGAVKQDAQSTLESYAFTLAVFDTGTQVVPPVTVHYRTAGDTVLRSVSTEPIAVFIRGVAVDTSKEIKDIKAPLSVPITFWDILPYLAGLIFLGGIVWVINYIRKKRAKGEPIIPEAPPRPAHEVALEKLRAVASENLWQRGMVKEFHSTLTDIIRTYIERKYSVIAMEMTSDEILGSRAIRGLDKPVTGKLREMLVRADLVKFAKYQPAPKEHEESLAHAFAFVEETTRPAVQNDVAVPAGEVTA